MVEEEYSVLADEFVRAISCVDRGRGGMSGRKPTFLLLRILIGIMALHLDQIRATAERVAASHGLDVVDIEYQGGTKYRILRVFIEKNAAQRARLVEEAKAADSEAVSSESAGTVQLAGITHDDCQVFSQDFGTVLDVEDLIPGADYTLEVSSPGLDRRLYGEADYRRFTGNLIKLQTFEAVAGNRHWQGRLTEVKDHAIVLDLSAVKQKGKARKNLANETVEIEFANIEKANLVPEI
jgi:ribosome maturation factor RimP